MMPFLYWFISSYNNESEDINWIVENITRLLDNTIVFVAQHLVGVQPHAQHVIKQLNDQQSKNITLSVSIYLPIWTI